MVRKDETALWAHLSAIVALTDITNTKNAEDALKESEEENRYDFT